MMSYRTARVVRVLVAFILMVGIIIGVVFTVRTVLQNNTAETNDTSRKSLTNTDAGRAVKIFVREPIVASESFYSYDIEISPSNRSLTVYKGYDSEISQQVVKSNTTASYKQFVYSLDNLGYMNGNELSGDANDDTGVCPTGRLYEFSILNNGETVKKLWSTSCNARDGSMSGEITNIRRLFIDQIDEADDIIDEIN